jgi:hypothetical protein
LNPYTQAVNVLQEYLDATDSVFDDGDLPGIETKLAYAMLILRQQAQYDGKPVTNQ